VARALLPHLLSCPRRVLLTCAGARVWHRRPASRACAPRWSGTGSYRGCCCSLCSACACSSATVCSSLPSLVAPSSQVCLPSCHCNRRVRGYVLGTSSLLAWLDSYLFYSDNDYSYIDFRTHGFLQNEYLKVQNVYKDQYKNIQVIILYRYASMVIR
jgi:hypothetical protein